MIRRQPVALVPAKVAAAQDYLRFAEVAKCGGPAAVTGNALPSQFARDLTPHEQQVYHDALEVLRLYFRGEMDFGPTMTEDDPDDDKPPSRQLTETE